MCIGRRMVFILLCFVSSLGASEPQIKFVKVLSSMDSPTDVAKWVHREASKNCLTWKYAVDPKTKKNCVLFITPTKDQVIYPGMNLPLDQSPVMNIQYYEEIVFEAKNIGTTPAPLQLVMIDDKGVSRYGFWEIKAGWHTYRVTIPEAFSERKLVQVQYGYDTPKENYKIYLSNLRIENNHYTKNYELLTTKIDNGQYVLSPELKKKYETLGAELKTYGAATSDSVITKWMDAVVRLNQEIYQYQVSNKIQQFESRYPNATWGYAWADGMTKVFRQDREFEGTFDKIGQVSLARNEYEGIQLVLRSKAKISHVTVTVSDLVSSSGTMISSKEIQVLPVGYVNTKRPPYSVDYVGWWPDPLLDFLKTFDLDGNVWQPVWLDIHTAADQKPGLYTGTITVNGNGVSSLKIPLEVTVWNLSVPHEKHFPLAINWFDGSEAVNVFESQYARDPQAFKEYKSYLKGELSRDKLTNPDSLRLLALREKMQKTIMDHRLNPLRIYNETPPLTTDVKMMKDAGFKDYCILMIWSQREVKKGDPYPSAKKKEYLAMLEEAVPRLEKAGLLDGAYVYGFDESDDNEFAAIKDIFGEIKKRWPQLKIMTTAYDYTYGLKTGLADVVDIWVPLTSKYEESFEQIQKARLRGENVWWYICMAPEHPYANWFVEYPGVEARLLMGIMPFKYESQGFLYYSLNYWKTGPVHTPFAEHLNKGPLTNYDGRSWADTNGDGLVFYPGDNGPVVTIRMKNIRDGLEDYEYLWLLQQNINKFKSGEVKAPEGWMVKAEQTMIHAMSLVKSMKVYTENSSEILKVRQEMALLLEELKK